MNQHFPGDEASTPREFKNPPTIVVPLVTIRGGGIVLVQRGLPDGYAKWALPGGHQEPGETWQKAGARELTEETGMHINPDDLVLWDFVTVPSGHNLLFCMTLNDWDAIEFTPQPGEVLDVKVVKSLDGYEFAFSEHERQARMWFNTK